MAQGEVSGDRVEALVHLFRVVDRGSTGGDYSQRDYLIRQVEEAGFFARQVEATGGFGATLADLRHRLLPWLAERRDWCRFVCWGAVAANLQGVAERLDEPALLEGLVAGGRFDFARALVEDLGDPDERLRARAVLVEVLVHREQGEPGEPAVGAPVALGQMVKSVTADVDRLLARRALTADRVVATLAPVARRVGTRLRRSWPGWIDTLDRRSATAADDLRRAVVDGFVRHGQPEADEVLDALASAHSPERVAGPLVELWRRRPPDPGSPFVRRLEHLDAVGAGGGASLRILGAIGDGSGALGGARARGGLDWLTGLWGELPWSVERIDAVGRLWGALPEERRETVRGSLDKQFVGWVFDVLVLEGRRDAESLERVGRSGDLLDEPRDVPGLARHLHWRLRALAACRAAGLSPARGGLSLDRVATDLVRVRYRVDAEDLATFLDLLAAEGGRRLGVTLEAVLIAPGADGERLRGVATRVRQAAVLELLIDDVERWAVLASKDSARGFELRRELLAAVTGPLCRLRGSLEPFELARQRVLPSEEDELRWAVLQDLLGHAAELAKRRGWTDELIGGIADRRLALVARLESLPPGSDPAPLLTPLMLYETLASVEPLTDELACLESLTEPPIDPGELAREHLGRVADRPRRIQGLIDLAHHTLDFHRGPGGDRRDRRSALLPLEQELGVVESTSWLLALTPELVEVGARADAAAGLEEIREAIERILALPDEALSDEDGGVGWPERRRTLFRVLGRSPRTLAAEPARGRALLRWAVRLPGRLAPDDGGRDLWGDWPRVLARLLALERRFPAAGGWLERFRKPVGALDVPTLERLWGASASDDSRWVVARFAGKGPLPGDESVRIEAEVLRLAVEEPSRVGATLGRLPRGPERDDLLEELAAGGWLAPAAARELPPLASDRRAAARVIVALGEGTPRSVSERLWMRAVGALATRGLLDPREPAQDTTRRLLWTTDRGVSLPTLARATIRTLELDRDATERTLRLFVGAAVRPRWGRIGRGRRRTIARLRRAVARATRLEGVQEDAEDDGEDEPEGTRVLRVHGRLARARSAAGQQVTGTPGLRRDWICGCGLLGLVPLMFVDGALLAAGSGAPRVGESGASLAPWVICCVVMGLAPVLFLVPAFVWHRQETPLPRWVVRQLAGIALRCVKAACSVWGTVGVVVVYLGLLFVVLPPLLLGLPLPVLAATSLVGHLLVFSSVRRMPWLGRDPSFAFAVSTLVPVPLVGLGVFAGGYVFGPRRPVVAAGHGGLGGLGRWSRWRELEGALSNRLERLRPRNRFSAGWRELAASVGEPPALGVVRLRVAWRKILWLVPSVALVGRGIAGTGGAEEPRALDLACWIGLGLTGLGVAVLVGWLVRCWWRWSRAADSPGYLTLQLATRVAAATTAGLAVGVALQQEDAAGISALLLLVGISGGMTNLVAELAAALSLPAPPRRDRTRDEQLHWLLFFLAVALFGLGLRTAEVDLVMFMQGLITLSIVLETLWSGARMRFIVAPLTPRTILWGGLSHRSHRVAALVLWSSLLPLGGLLAPLWPWIFERRWPQVEREILERSLGRALGQSGSR